MRTTSFVVSSRGPKALFDLNSTRITMLPSSKTQETQLSRQIAPTKLFGKIDLFTQLMIDLICCNTMCELARLRWNFLAKKEMNGWNKFWSNIFDFFLVFCCIPYWLDGLMGFENLINIFLYFLFFNCELFIVLEFSPFELTNPRFSIIK